MEHYNRDHYYVMSRFIKISLTVVAVALVVALGSAYR